MTTPFERLISCGNCRGILHHPIRLRTCQHVFCVNCINWHVQGTKITCPVCNVDCDLPDVAQDPGIRDIVAVFLCADCQTVDRNTQACVVCGSRCCLDCVRSHRSEETCAVLAAFRDLKQAVPTVQQVQQRCAEWEEFKIRNKQQKTKSDGNLTTLINTLQDSREKLLQKYDDYDTYAQEQIDKLKSAGEIAVIMESIESSLNMQIAEYRRVGEAIEAIAEKIPKLEAVIEEEAPEPLGIVPIQRQKIDLESMAPQIKMRQPGDDDPYQLLPLWQSDVDMYTFHLNEEEHAFKKIGKGKMEILRGLGGYYELRTIVGEKPHTFRWNNLQIDDYTPRLKTRPELVTWSLHAADDVSFQTFAVGAPSNHLPIFKNILEQAIAEEEI